MILGPSHITLGCCDIDAGIESLRKIGYEPQFIDRELPNDPSKRKFLSGSWVLHAVAYTKAAVGLPIELVSYGAQMPEPCGRYIGVFDADADGAAAVVSSPIQGLAAAALGKTSLCELTDFGVPACFKKASNGSGGLSAAILAVDNVAGARKFWCSAVGFQAGAHSMDPTQWQRLDFVSPVRSWRFTLFLIASPETVARPYLNARGMACLSFVCTDVAGDRENLVAHGAEGAERFRTCVNGKDMIIEILRGPDGAYIELLQLDRGAKQ